MYKWLLLLIALCVASSSCSKQIKNNRPSELSTKPGVIYDKNDEFVPVERLLGCVSGDCLNGIGQFQYKDNSMYNGQWKDGKYHGKGVYTHPDGTRYEGDFWNGEYHGKGVFTFSDGTIYTGEFKNSAANGFGIKTYTDGTRYHGQWKDGKPHGSGVIYDSQNRSIQKGRWVEGNYIGL